MNWKEPFKFAFELAMWGLGWLLVIFVASIIILVAAVIIKSLLSAVKKKKAEVPQPKGLKVVKE